MIEKGAKGLGKNKSILKLSMARCKINDEFLKEFTIAFQMNKSLISVNLKQNDIRDIGGILLARTIGTLLPEPYASNRSGVSEESTNLICPVISKSRIEVLNLSKNMIGDKGGLQLSKLLQMVDVQRFHEVYNAQALDQPLAVLKRRNQLPDGKHNHCVVNLNLSDN